MGAEHPNPVVADQTGRSSSLSPRPLGGVCENSSTAYIVLGLTGLTVIAKALGFGEKLVIAHLFGTSPVADSYFMVMTLVLSIGFLARELINPSLLPVMTDAARTSAVAAISLSRSILVLVIAVTSPMAVLCITSPEAVISVVAPGFDQERQHLATHLLQWAGPAVMILGLIAVTRTVLHSNGRFFAVSLSETAAKAAFIVGLLALVPVLGAPGGAIAFAVSALLCLLLQMGLVSRPLGLSAILSSGWRSRGHLKRVLRLAAPLCVGVLLSHVGDLVDNAFASRLHAGELSYVNYSKRLMDACLLIMAAPLVTVWFTKAASLAARGRLSTLHDTVSRAARLLAFVAVPVSILLVKLREPLVACLFQHGQFGAGSTAGTAQALALFACGFPAQALDGLIVATFFALSNTRLPVAAGAIGVGVNIALVIVLIDVIGFSAIPLATSVTKTAKVAVLVLLLRKALTGRAWPGKTTWVFLAKLLCASMVLWVAVGAVTAEGATFWAMAGRGLGLPALVAVAAYLATASLLGMSEVRAIPASLRESLRIRRG